MNVPAYAIIDKPKARPPPKVTSSFDLTYDQACIEFLYACLNGLPAEEIRARAWRMRESRMRINQ